MPITFDKQNKVFKLDGKDFSYIFNIAYDFWPSHLYFGKKVDSINPSRLSISRELGFSPSPMEFFYNRKVSLDTLPQEYPSFGYTDFRIPGIIIEQVNGSRLTDFRYKSHRIYNKKPTITGMPSINSQEGDSTTLELTLLDAVTNVEAVLYYNVYEKRNVLTRHVKIINNGSSKVILNKVSSCSIDFPTFDYSFMQLHGSHCQERHIEITPLRHGIQSIESRRGSSSHMLNPFFALLSKDSSEDYGEVFGFNFVYSGSYVGEVEVDQMGTARVQMGLSDHDFAWNLNVNESFESPEVVIVYSITGLSGMSFTFHDLYNERLLKRHYQHPIVINNWEATYFDFNEKKLKVLLESAKGLGIETFVLDDGWFGKRNNDESGLGDWKVNLDKLPCGLEGIEKIAKENGLNFGLWFEPEMISIDSDLYRKHPDWAIRVIDREHAISRCQLALDLSRKEICDYVVKSIADLLEKINITYIKWDFNRNITETYDKSIAHKYVLGLYYILEQLTTKYPNVMIEGCSGGGGRVDPGILYYCPQIWTSDNSDAIERLYIQYGTSIVYPPTTMVGHVSKSPNHQTGRETPIDTRGIVAMSANFGYELNPVEFTQKERKIVMKQTAIYTKIRKVLYSSDFYRLRNPFTGNDCAWSFVSKDKAHVFVMYVKILSKGSNPIDRLKLKGFDDNATYKLVDTKQVFKGSELNNIGIVLSRASWDFRAWMFEFVKI